MRRFCLCAPAALARIWAIFFDSVEIPSLKPGKRVIFELGPWARRGKIFAFSSEKGDPADLSVELSVERKVQRKVQRKVERKANTSKYMQIQRNTSKYQNEGGAEWRYFTPGRDGFGGSWFGISLCVCLSVCSGWVAARRPTPLLGKGGKAGQATHPSHPRDPP